MTKTSQFSIMNDINDIVNEKRISPFHEQSFTKNANSHVTCERSFKKPDPYHIRTETMEAASLIYTGHRSDSIQCTHYITNDYIVLSS